MDRTETMWQSNYSYDDSQTFAYGSQSSGYSGYDGFPQHDDFQPDNSQPESSHQDSSHQDGAAQDGAAQDGAAQDDSMRNHLGHGGYQGNDFQPEGCSGYGEHYQTQEFHYYHSEHHVDSSAFHA
ncbi:hypothetical protein [Actinoplanes sp. NPDC020271]|uniref:hypothetical protein n=1 Tax=Actinoplanes sp. NPDC020271 TaxID=3363896 RepID=UPI00378C5EE2